jgi:hypothetical protein
MITTINRLAHELEAIATAHLQLQSFYYGDIVQTYNSLGAVEHCTLLCDIKNAVINDGYTSCTLELMVLDRVLTLDSEVGNKPQQEVESDTLQIINDLYFIIGYSARWQAFGMIEQGSAARKVVENTPDKVTGWYISINLRLRNQQGICDLPVIDYDYGQVAYPQNCPGVTIIRNGDFLEIVESGGTFSFQTNGCPEITLTLPDGSFAFPNTDCGISTQVLQNDVQVEATFDENGNLIIPPFEPCEPVTYNITRDGEPFASGSEPSGGDISINVPSDCPECDPAIVSFAGYPMLSIADPCGSDTDIDCDTPIELWRITEAEEETLVQEYIERIQGNYQGVTSSTVTIAFTGSAWHIIELGVNIYSAEGDIDTPITDLIWMPLNGQSSVPVIEQFTIGTYCNPCQTLPELLAAITAENVISEVWDNLAEAAQGEIKDTQCPVADPVNLQVEGSTVASLAPGSTANITVVQDGSSVDVLAVTNPSAGVYQIKTKWRCSNLVDHITLEEPNPFGNTKAYTGITGGYKVGASYFNADGSAAASEAAAFPNNLVCVWIVSKYDAVSVVSRFINSPLGSNNDANQITALATLNSGGYAGHNDWKRISKNTAFNMANGGLANEAMNFDPFNQTDYSSLTVTQVFCEQEFASLPTQRWRLSTQTADMGGSAKTNNRGAWIERLYTFAQLGL